MTALETVPMPSRLADLPRDRRGYPVPWFVQWFDDGKPTEPGDGQPDFRVVDERKLKVAVVRKRCWLCGEPLGSYKTFVVGPMCAINRVSSEPPSHTECAIYAAKVCPFLTNPKVHRVEATMPDGLVKPAGEMVPRNPGVALVWTTRRHQVRVLPDGVLFQIGDPDTVLWFAHGRRATRAEIEVPFDSGAAILRAEAEAESMYAVKAYERQVAAARNLIPEAS